MTRNEKEVLLALLGWRVATWFDGDILYWHPEKPPGSFYSVCKQEGISDKEESGN